MREIVHTSYMCERCGKIYSTKEDAMACERNHANIKSQHIRKEDGYDSNGHPKTVIIDFDDGRSIVYRGVFTSPKEFATKMKQYSEKHDFVARHIDADYLMSSVLEEFGYKEGVEIFKDMYRSYDY